MPVNPASSSSAEACPLLKYPTSSDTIHNVPKGSAPPTYKGTSRHSGKETPASTSHEYTRSGLCTSTTDLWSSVIPHGLQSRGVVAPLNSSSVPRKCCQRNSSPVFS